MNASLRKPCLELPRIVSVSPLQLSASAHDIFEHIGGFFNLLGHFFRYTLIDKSHRHGLFSRSNSIVPVRENANRPAAKSTAVLAMVWAGIQHQVKRFAIRPIDTRDSRRNGDELLSAVGASLEISEHQDISIGAASFSVSQILRAHTRAGVQKTPLHRAPKCLKRRARERAV